MYNKSMSFKQTSVSKLTWLRVIPVCGCPQPDSQPPQGGTRLCAAVAHRCPVRRPPLGRGWEGGPASHTVWGSQAGSRQRGYKWTGRAR